MVDKMRRRVIELAEGRVVRDEQAGAYTADESTREFARADARERLGVKLGFFLREALRALKRNAVPSFAAMATVLVTVLRARRLHPGRAGHHGCRQRRARAA